MQSLRDTQNLHKILERKAELTVRGEKLALQKLYEAEADVEVKHWEKRNSDMALDEFNQEFESQRFQLQQANRWADQAQRDKIILYGEMELRNRLFQEQARQPRSEELSLQQERNPTTVSQLLTQIREL